MRFQIKVFMLVALCIPTISKALPRYAIFEGVSCSSCHTNPTGGGKRNDTGGQFFMRDLSLASTRHLAPKEASGRLTSFVAVGTDLRVHNTTAFSTPRTNTFTVPQASLYAEFNAGQHITGYLDQDFANTNRELFLMVHDNSPPRFYAKIGHMNLPYGLRLADDTSFIRSNFNMTYANQDIGVEIGAAPGPFEFLASVSNGVPGGPAVADENAAKAITSQINWIGEHGRIGTSFQFNRRSATRLLMGGLHGGFKWWRTVWLGEIDLQQNHSRTGGGNTIVLAGYSELNWLIIDGLYAKTIYDILDPDYRVANNLSHRLGFGVDLFPLPFSQVSLLYRFNIGSGAASDDAVMVEAHFFF